MIKSKQNQEDNGLVPIPHIGPDICNIYPPAVDVTAQADAMFMQEGKTISGHIDKSPVDAFSGSRFDNKVDAVSSLGKSMVDIQAANRLQCADDIAKERQHRALYDDILLNELLPAIDKIFDDFGSIK